MSACIWVFPLISHSFVQDHRGSYDFVDNDHDVTPGYSHGERDNHGTSCAGEIAMAKDNNICGVGVAYEARVAGITG